MGSTGLASQYAMAHNRAHAVFLCALHGFARYGRAVWGSFGNAGPIARYANLHSLPTHDWRHGGWINPCYGVFAMTIPSIRQSSLIPVFTGLIGGQTLQLVNARDLHAFLQVGRDFTNWIKSRIDKYGFVENQDFQVFANSGENPAGGRPTSDYHLTLDTAKELAMVENNEQGRAARRYFIDIERRHHAAAVQQSLTAPARPARALHSPESIHILNAIRASTDQWLKPWNPDLRMDYFECQTAIADTEKFLLVCAGHGLQTDNLQQRIKAAGQMLASYHSRLRDTSSLITSLRFGIDIDCHPTYVTNAGPKVR